MGMTPWMAALRRRVGHELLLLPGVAAVIRNDAGQVLCQRRSETGEWGLPAGGLDPGETPAEGIVREVREETGLEVEPVRVLGVFGGRAQRVTYPNGDVVEFTAIVFACRVVGGTLASEDDETAGLRWFAVDALPPLSSPYPAELFRMADDAPALFDGVAGTRN